MAQQYTRMEIRNIFVNMLNERPLSKITVKDIVTECKINRNTFYYYYSDIYEVIEEIFNTELQRVIDEYNETLSWEESFLLATKFALENKRAIYNVYDSVRKDIVEKYIFNMAGSIIGKYIERVSQGSYASIEDKKIITLFYQSALTGMVFNWLETGMKEDASKIIPRIGALLDGNIELSLKRSEELNNN